MQRTYSENISIQIEAESGKEADRGSIGRGNQRDHARGEEDYHREGDQREGGNVKKAERRRGGQSISNEREGGGGRQIESDST